MPLDATTHALRKWETRNTGYFCLPRYGSTWRGRFPRFSHVDSCIKPPSCSGSRRPRISFVFEENINIRSRWNRQLEGM